MNWQWVTKRVLQALFTIYLVISFTFVLIRQLPGGPADYIRAQLIGSGTLSAQERERLDSLVQTYVNINPDKPLHEQYIEYMASTLQADLGQSVWHNEPVIDLIAEALPWTLFVMMTAILLSFSLGITFGALMAYTEGSRFDMGLSTTLSLFNSIPYYIVGILAVYILAYQYGWFPTSGHHSYSVTPGFNIDFIVDIFYHAALPVLSIVVTGAGGRALGMRGNSVRVMGEDYIRVAELRGLSSRRIALHYVGRNAILPMYTNFMIAIGFLFGGAVILEQIFAYRGVGLLLFESIGTRDYPLMMGSFLVITIAVVLAILIADLTYGKLDPRISAGGAR
ncbi:ABC transporter permease [Halomarina rubra]|uniref:ABC transporter permease n=1 Tax=Halomarina rubra TaxID=2071873 RepID=A0ABD6AQF6_9EURY|nr:ABC transporter permease [Halomarina rubra]